MFEVNVKHVTEEWNGGGGTQLMFGVLIFKKKKILIAIIFLNLGWGEFSAFFLDKRPIYDFVFNTSCYGTPIPNLRFLN